MRPVLFAVLSDIHANYQALKAVAADAQQVRVRLGAKALRYVVLGDVVDYGPQPNECMEWVKNNAEILVQGNHDLDVANSMYQEPKSIASRFWPITIWTRKILRRGYKDVILNQWQLERCCDDLPSELKNFMAFHSSLTARWERIDDAYAAWETIQRLRDGAIYGLFGHTHVQGYFVEDPLRKRRTKDKTTTPYLIFPERCDLEKSGSSEHWEAVLLETDSKSDTGNVGQTPWAELPPHPALFNPGGLGQPRPSGPTRLSGVSDNRASYMLLKSNGRIHFQFRRVPYDCNETIQRLRSDVRLEKDSVWPPPSYSPSGGSDILKGDRNPYPRPVWDGLLAGYRDTLRNVHQLLPELVEDVLIPQLR